MEIFIRMPKLGLTMTEGIIGRWLIKEGDEFEEGDDLVEIESDKSVLTEQARTSGVLVKILQTEGCVVPIFENIAIICIDE